jgi:zinc protease
MPRRPTRRTTLAAAALAASLAAALATPLAAQPSALTPPLPAPNRPHAFRSTRDTTTTSFTVGGLQVILRRVTANDVVAVNLYLLGGTRQVPAEQAGLEPFLLAASERGTAAYPRDVMRARMARLGTGIGVDADLDWTTFALRSTTATLDSTWAIFADRLMRPTLDAGEVERVREQAVSAVRQRGDSPDAYLEFLADSVTYAGHPYGISPEGTEATLSRLTLADLRRYQREQMVTSRMLLVVVGDVDRAHLERLVGATLGRLPAGGYRWTPPPPPPPARAGTTVAVTQRPLPTNYVLGYFIGPPAGSPDATALRLATAVLSGRFFSEVRSKRNLSYAVSAPFLDRSTTAAGLYVTTVDPATTLRIMREELTNLQEGWITPRGLDQLVQQFITDYFLDNETNGDQANFLARAQLYRGDWRRAATFVDELRGVSPDDIRRVSRQYLRGVRLAYVGDPARLDPRAVAAF